MQKDNPGKSSAPQNEAEARRHVEAALQAFRKACADYRRVTDNAPPDFFLAKAAPPIPQAALKGCRVFPERGSMLRSPLIPSGGKVAEVGTLWGYWAGRILEAKQPDELHLFDLTFKTLMSEVREDRRVTLHEGDSSSLLAAMPDAYFDWIYIDGDHTYEGVCRDVVVAEKKIREGGVLVFNDYTSWSPLEAVPYGIATCVNEMLATRQWKVIALALTPSGYYDIALARRTPENWPTKARI